MSEPIYRCRPLSQLPDEQFAELESAVTVERQRRSPRAAWVKVSERLPEINQDVLLIGPYWDRTSIGQRCLFPKNKMRNADSWFWEMSLNGHLMTCDGAVTPMEYECDEVTHWMPLPQAPEGE